MRSNWFFAVAGLCLGVSFLLSESYPTAVAQEGAGRASLTIDLVGFKDTSGKASIRLFDNGNSFKSADIRKDRKEVEKYFRSLVDVPIQVAGNNLSARCKIANLQPGEYAAFAFHDGNGNGKVDSNLVGVPTEGFGFSNDVRPQVLPIPKSPTWKAVSFVVQPGENSIRIHVRD
ncbi:DUF2141 domain-containing protein [Singulisphaera rosea]